MAYFHRPMARSSLALSLVFTLLATAAGVAHAHPILEEAQQRFDEADFEGALESYSRAERAGDLTRADLVQLYVQRALIHHTLGNSADLETDLMRISSGRERDAEAAIPESDVDARMPAEVEGALRELGYIE